MRFNKSQLTVWARSASALLVEPCVPRSHPNRGGAHVTLLPSMGGCDCQARRASKHPRSRRWQAGFRVNATCRDGGRRGSPDIICPTARGTPLRSAPRSTQWPIQQLRTVISITVVLVATLRGGVVAYGDVSQAGSDEHAHGDGGGAAVGHSTGTDQSPTIMVVVGQGDRKSGRNTPVAADHGLRLRVLAESIVNSTFRFPTGPRRPRPGARVRVCVVGNAPGHAVARDVFEDKDHGGVFELVLLEITTNTLRRRNQELAKEVGINDLCFVGACMQCMFECASQVNVG